MIKKKKVIKKQLRQLTNIERSVICLPTYSMTNKGFEKWKKDVREILKDRNKKNVNNFIDSITSIRVNKNLYNNEVSNIEKNVLFFVSFFATYFGTITLLYSPIIFLKGLLFSIFLFIVYKIVE